MNIFEGTHIKLDLKRYPNQVFFFKEDVFWMEYYWENGYLWCRYRDFWEVLETENNCEVQAFINKQAGERYKINSKVRFESDESWLKTVENHFFTLK